METRRGTNEPRNCQEENSDSGLALARRGVTGEDGGHDLPDIVAVDQGPTGGRAALDQLGGSVSRAALPVAMPAPHLSASPSWSTGSWREWSEMS
jgi:hypothetical protein